MKIKKLFLSTVAACLLFASLTGCTAETPLLPTEAEGDDDLCTFTLSAGSRILIETRAIEETAIKDVWVVQLNSAGTAALTTPQYLTADATGKIKAQLAKVNSKVYFFANTDNANLFNRTAALSSFTATTVEAIKIAHTGDWGTRSHTPMYGTWTGTPKAPALTGNSNDKVVLTPVLAKITFQLSTTDIFVNQCLLIESIQLRNVPISTRMAPTASGVYPPATSTNDFKDYPAQTINELVNTGNNPLKLYFFMPENCRGIDSESDQTKKDGSKLSGGAYATYVEVKCKFKGDSSYPTTLNYRFYLGENNYNNYNIKRGLSYTFNIIISGFNSADMRVKVDGYKTLSTSNPVIIGGIKWARTNLKQEGSGHTAPVSCYSQPWEQDINGLWNWGMLDQKDYTTYLQGDNLNWNTQTGANQDPCSAYGDGSWRVPTKEEFESLLRYVAPAGTGVMINGKLHCVINKGFAFGNYSTPLYIVIDGDNVLGFPPASLRAGDGSAQYPYTYYWSQNSYEDDRAYLMNFDIGEWMQPKRYLGASLRCVKR